MECTDIAINKSQNAHLKLTNASDKDLSINKTCEHDSLIYTSLVAGLHKSGHANLITQVGCLLLVFI